MSAKITIRIPLQQYGYLEVSGEDVESVQSLAEQALIKQLHATGIEIEKVAQLEAGGITAASVSTHATPVAEQGPPPVWITTSAPPTTPVVQAAATPGVPVCAHGPRTFKEGVSKAGKPYKLWACTAPREQQCKAEWA